MAKRKFRKVYIICQDNAVFGKPEYEVVDIFRIKSNAVGTCTVRQRNAMDEAKKMYNQGAAVPKYSVHGFYLVHESYFDEQ